MIVGTMCATHLLGDGYDIQTVLKLLRHGPTRIAFLQDRNDLGFRESTLPHADPSGRAFTR
jgi:hypothetical protein